MKNIIEQILDKNYKGLIKVPGLNGEVFTFEQLALLHMEEASFTILHPIAKDVCPDDVLVFRIDYDGDEVSLVLEEDETIIEKCFDQYYIMYNKNGRRKK